MSMEILKGGNEVNLSPKLAADECVCEMKSSILSDPDINTQLWGHT